MASNGKNMQDIDLRPEKSIFLPAILSVLLISIPMIFWPSASEAVLKACDASVYIPMAGDAESLNASVAASVLMWEMCRNH